MNESTHDLIVAKAARLRELARLASADGAELGGVAAVSEPDASDNERHAPTWSGWNN